MNPFDPNFAKKESLEAWLARGRLIITNTETRSMDGEQHIIDLPTCPCGELLHHIGEVAAFCVLCDRDMCAKCSKNICTMCRRIVCVQCSTSDPVICAAHGFFSRLLSRLSKSNNDDETA